MSISSSYWGRAIGAFFLSIAILAVAPSAPAQSDSSGPTPDASRLTSFDIPAQNLATALTEFARQSNQELFYLPEMAEGKTTEGVTGTMTTSAAMDALLEGTGLEFEPTPNGSLLIGDRATLDARRAEWQSSAAGQQQSTIGQRRPGIEEIIVTGQKREERIQDVPIAISAFSPEDLEAQKIEGGFDLLKGVPNVTFSKTNFSGYNFQIRGIGTQAISATTDPGVAVSFNSSTLIVNRLFEQEYLDVERVEVLRGPQGTLYGRNATSGVINVISNKPELGVWDGMVDVEVGNYNTRRLRGFFNAPIGDTLAIRGAYASTVRDGFGINEAAADPDVQTGVSADVDGRDLWTGRLTLGWEPIDRIRVNLLWERFEEDDNRARTSKQLCHRDPGPETIGAFSWDSLSPLNQVTQRALTSQGCKAGSLYDDAAYGTPNGASLPFINALMTAPALGIGLAGAPPGLGYSPYWGFFPNPPEAPCAVLEETNVGFPLDLCNPDPYSGLVQSRDLRTIYSQIEPIYRAEADIFELSIDINLTDGLTLTSQTVYAQDEYYATQDFNRYTTAPMFADSEFYCDSIIGAAGFAPCNGGGLHGGHYNVLPGGFYDDPQLGRSNSLLAQDLSEASSEQLNQEFRLASSFGGPVNYSLGANFTRFETLNDYYVFANAFTLLTHFFPYNMHNGCYGTSEPGPCIYVDPNPLEEINGEGHNYFRSANPYELTSSALFGELYWNATDTVKITLGARMTWDRKVFTPIPSQLLLGDYRDVSFVPEGAGPEACDVSDPCTLKGSGIDGRGSPPNRDIVQEWREPTGRLVVDWSPDLAFTDESMFYASYSHGYKGGGANPPSIAPPAGLFNEEASAVVSPPTFEPEYIDAFEIGTKNTLFGGGLILNASAFYYDYEGYQVSKIVDRSAANENFDAKNWGAELEVVFAPSLDWQFNAAIGYLQTEIAEGETSIDLMDRAAGGDTPYTTAAGDTYDRWMVLKPFLTNASNCIAPVALVEQLLLWPDSTFGMQAMCPGGNVVGHTYFAPDGTSASNVHELPWGEVYSGAPNGGAGFSKDLGGNELPQAPEFTVALGGQYNFDLTRDWRATARVDYYWQDKSFARVYNMEYDRLRSWSNTNLSFWVNNPVNGITLEAYVKNVFNETPITGSFLNSDDSGLTTNVFTLDPRLIGVSIRKEF